jgi:uncharacterized protein (TIGR03083 family)
MRDAYLEAVDSAIGLLSAQPVADQWSRPSCLADWSVGGLAAHLASQVSLTARVLASPAGRQQPIPLLEHYARAAWVRADVDDEVNVSIRASTDAVSAAGPAKLLAQTRQARADVAVTLDEQPLDRVFVIPWQGWALTLHDYLVTRMMEIAVHSDDLAVSIGVEPPRLPDQVLDPVLTLLAGLAVQRHGQPAVLRAFARKERAPSSVAAF